MVRCKVSSGEFEIILMQHSMREAANEAIRLHDKRASTSILGDLTLVEEVTEKNEPTGSHLFLGTKLLIEQNTVGYGVGRGQYTNINQDEKSND